MAPLEGERNYTREGFPDCKTASFISAGLQPKQMGIYPAPGKQFGMLALFDDLSVAYHKDLLRKRGV